MTQTLLGRRPSSDAAAEPATHSEPGPRWGAGLGLFAVLVEWLGFHWDIAWHGDIGRDRFLTPPHTMILTGIVGAAAVAIATLSYATAPERRRRPGIMLLGGSAVAAGITLAIDNWFHHAFGVDLGMWSPPHILLGLTFMVGAVGVMIDVAGARSRPVTLAVLAGAWLAPATLSLAEYEFGFPHHRVLWSPVLLAALVGFTFALARAASGHRFAGTIAASTFIALRLVAVAFNVAVSRSLPSIPLGVLAGGIAFDLARRGWARSAVAAWAATFFAQATWLHLVGKTWWSASVLVPGFALGLVTVLAGAWIGTALGATLSAAAASDRTRNAPNGRTVAITTALLLATLAALSGWGQLMEKRVGYPATYSVDSSHVRLTIDGASDGDWVSVFGPRHPIGIFDATPRAGVYLPRLAFVSIPPEVQGPRLRALNVFPARHSWSWLGTLHWHDGAFEGRIHGDGEFIGLWYVRGEHAAQAIVERGSHGPIILVRHAAAPAVPPARSTAPLGTALVAALTVLLMLGTGWAARPCADQLP